MARPERQRSEWNGFIAVLLFIGLGAAWALIPSASLDTAWQAERQQMSAWAGDASQHWIMAQAAGAMKETLGHARQASGGLGDSPIERWLRDRIYFSLLWANLILFRGYALLMWGLLGIPLILAAAADGFYIREIRKTAFISQSPIRHKLGVHFFRWVSLGLILWLCLPAPTPFFAAPSVVLFLALSLSLWLWLANLQKRL